MSSMTNATARPVSTIWKASGWPFAEMMFMPRFFWPLISVICLMLVVPAVETMGLPFRSSSEWIFADFFVTANRWVAKKSAKIHSLDDLKGKPIVSPAGTTNIKQITEINGQKNLGMNIISANGHPEAFQMVETGRAVAFVMDDILLYSLAAQSRNPKDYEISPDALSVEPYGIMLRKDDKEFKRVVDAAMTGIYKSGEINKIYEKWFQKPVPPKGINLNVPMSEQFKKVVKNPTSSGDPNDYK